jgi:Raf kinase inhibitor-like YbhB/YbcL family protein
LTRSAADPKNVVMKLWSDSFPNRGYIPPHYALGRHNPRTHVELSDNVNPHLAWSDLPSATRSLALLCVDVDVPSRGDDVNKEDRLVPADLPRVDFYHWVLIDLSADAKPISEGEFSRGVTARGKNGPAGPRDTRSGLNDYTGWFRGDREMEGQYFGYDGPCPPWNDSLVHHYHFRLYALDVPQLPLEGTFTGQQAAAAIQGHRLGEASIEGSYAIYPKAVERSVEKR